VAVKISPGGSVEVLIVQGNNRQGLAVARSLARHSVRFALASDQADGPAFHSRFVRDHLLSPHPLTQSEAFAGFLSEVIQKLDIRLVIPAGDQALLFLNSFRSHLPDQTKLATASPQAVERVIDKRLNLELATRLGVPCPRQFELQHPGQIPEMIQVLGLPVVLKPPCVPNHPDRPRFNFKVLYAHTEQQLRSYIQEHCSDGHYPLFQECAVGEVHCLCCFAVRGEVIAVHAYQPIRRRAGLGILRRIVTPRPDLVQHTRDLLRGLAWDGIAHVAFYVSHDGQKKWYMETNGRFWASTEGSVQAGWDFPYWVYRYFLHGERPVPAEIRIGSQTCWRGGDLVALLEYYRGGEPPAAGTDLGKVLATWQYLSSFSPRVHSDLARWNDPMPEVMEHWQIANRSWRFAKSRLAKILKSPRKTLPV
jgi:predicted ATP-grasp superfamily ATP-dependent carboligase